MYANLVLYRSTSSSKRPLEMSKPPPLHSTTHHPQCCLIHKIIPEGDFPEACHFNRLHLPDDELLITGQIDLGRVHLTLVVPQHMHIFLDVPLTEDLGCCRYRNTGCCRYRRGLLQVQEEEEEGSQEPPGAHQPHQKLWPPAVLFWNGCDHGCRLARAAVAHLPQKQMRTQKQMMTQNTQETSGVETSVRGSVMELKTQTQTQKTGLLQGRLLQLAPSPLLNCLPFLPSSKGRLPTPCHRLQHHHNLCFCPDVQHHLCHLCQGPQTAP